MRFADSARSNGWNCLLIEFASERHETGLATWLSRGGRWRAVINALMSAVRANVGAKLKTPDVLVKFAYIHREMPKLPWFASSGATIPAVSCRPSEEHRPEDRGSLVRRASSWTAK